MATAEAGFGEGAIAYEQTPDRLNEAFKRGPDAARAAGPKDPSPAVASGKEDPARDADPAGARIPMKEALAFYEREADMLKERVLASRQALSLQYWNSV